MQVGVRMRETKLQVQVLPLWTLFGSQGTPIKTLVHVTTLEPEGSCREGGRTGLSPKSWQLCLSTFPLRNR
jgi:hypothetical protein